MRKLTIKPRIYEGHIRSLEKHIGAKFPILFEEFLLLYADTSVEERVYHDENGLEWIISRFWNYPNIHGLTKEFQREGHGTKVAFGHDEGGWSYCLSLDPEDYNAVYVYRFTDHAPEETFLKIADSFEEFIDKLEPERQDQ